MKNTAKGQNNVEGIQPTIYNNDSKIVNVILEHKFSGEEPTVYKRISVNYNCLAINPIRPASAGSQSTSPSCSFESQREDSCSTR